LNSLEIQTFGGLQIRLDRKILDGLKTRKVAALLVYVVMNGQSVERSRLADLFWHELPEDKARANLRVALSNLRKNLPAFMQITQFQVQIHPEADVWLDAAEIERYVSQGNFDAALGFYQGAFLDGFHLRHAPGFEEWQTFTREKYRLLIQENMHKLIERELSEGAFKSGLLHARRLLELDPLDEFAHRFAMQFYSMRGQRSVALRQYEACKQNLLLELGVEPDEETTRLNDAIAAGEVTAPQFDYPNDISTAGSKLPADLTPFVGREKEIEQTINLLKDPANRLVTIQGAGGMGKTRLALEASRKLDDHFADGIFFVPLVSIGDPDTIPSKIAEVLGIQLQSGMEDHLQLIHFLTPKQLLLVLDNFEHLRDGASLIKEILKSAENVKVITTSREQLNIPGETIVYLTGMPYPASAEAADVDRFGSLRLFFQSAKRANPNFLINHSNVQSIAKICHLVDGLPLGIELAAAWVDHLPINIIADEVEKNLGFLQTKMVGDANRQESVRAVFESSWARLSREEQLGFAKLSVFRGGFTTQAAKDVAGAGLRLLSILFNKSLLYPPKDGRYQIHELLRQFAAEKLAEKREDEKRAQNLCTEYFADLIHQQEDQIYRGNLDLLLSEIDNVRASWHFAVSDYQYNNIEKMVDAFGEFLEQGGWINEGVSIFSWVDQTVQEREATFISSLAHGKSLFRYGYFLFRSGQESKGAEIVQTAHKLLCEINAEKECAHVRMWMVELAPSKDKEESEKQLQECLEIFRRLNNSGLINFAGLYMAVHSLYWGEYDKAGRKYQETYLKYENDKNDAGTAFALFGMGIAADFQADYVLAQQKYEEAIDRFQEVRFITMLGVVYQHAGNMHLANDAFSSANIYFQKSLEFNRRTGIEWRVADAQHGLARVAIAREDFDSAEKYLNQSMISDHFSEKLTTNGYRFCFLGYLALSQGEFQLAGQHFLDALQISQTDFSGFVLAQLVMAQSSSLLAKSGEMIFATEITSLVLSQPGKIQPMIQHVSRNSLESHRALLSEEEFSFAIARGRVLEFEPAKLELINMLVNLTK